MTENNPKYPHLDLFEWPFQVTPDENFYSFMADRSQVVEDISTVLRNLSRRTPSTIHLLWAWYGAGKTHTLRHMEYLCKENYPGLFPVYTEMPRSIRSFSDLYRSLARTIDFEMVRDFFLDVVTSKESVTIERELRHLSLDMFNAFNMMCVGDNRQQETVLRWLKGEQLPIGELRNHGIGRRITTAEDAINAIEWIVKIFHERGRLSSEGSGRIIWMIDEFQLIGNSKAIAREVNSSLHSVFNRCSNSLSLFISFSGMPEKTYPSWLSPELVDRIGIQKVILLPPLSRGEAREFIRDVLNHFRPNSTELGLGFYPFQEEAVDRILDIIEKDNKEIRPRNLMQYFNGVLEVADSLIENKQMESIDPEFAVTCLKDRLIGDLE